MSETRYSLAPGLEIVPLGEARFELRSDFVAMELSGETAADLVERVLLGFDHPLTLEEIALRMPGYQPESLRAQLEALLRERVLVAVRSESPGFNPTFSLLLDEIGLDSQATIDRLSNSRVAVFGLEAHGAHVAKMLADSGVGTLVLVDPFPFESAHRTLTPVQDLEAIGLSRQGAVSRLLSRPGLNIETAANDALDKERVAELAEGCQLLIVCWDRGFAVAHHWANEAALKHGVPTLFSELRATSSFAGPFFLPFRSACWMCYRMRSLACEKDFELAMAYEEHLDRKRHPTLVAGPVLPILPVQLASTLALEALKYLVRLNQPVLVDRVLEFDGLHSEPQLHPVLIKPFCTACSKKKARSNPSRADLLQNRPRLKSLAEIADRLVSNRTGIVSEFAAANRDATEPSQPMVWRARLSNHRFLSEQSDTHAACSGKGMTRQAAWTSCLGEAVERYSGGVWTPDELKVCKRAALEGRSLDPRDLVLYRPDQYTELPYSIYSEGSELAWVRGRSLLDDAAVWIPAIAIFMEYEVASAEEYLFPITSNGLAAGPTLCDAVLSAIYEVLERDALLISWLNQLPAKSYDAERHPDPVVSELALSWARRGVRLALFELATDHPVSVFLGIAFQESGFGGPYATIGLGAHLDPVAAARGAALEVGQVRPAFRERARVHDGARIQELVADPSEVKTLEDHALLYADPSTAPAFDFLNGGKADWPEVTDPDSASALRILLEHFASVDQEVLYVNLTPPDLEPFGLYTARAILPGFQPIWFGRQERRLGGTRLFELPQQLRLKDRIADLESLNPLPHPLA